MPFVEGATIKKLVKKIALPPSQSTFRATSTEIIYFFCFNQKNILQTIVEMIF